MDWEHHQGMDNQGMQYEDQLKGYLLGGPQNGETRFWEYETDRLNPAGYIRDPRRLITYLIPFPRPTFAIGSDHSTIPERFLIYTPPPPPLVKPADGSKEGKVSSVRRKWQQHMRNAKTSTAPTASWKGMTSKAMKGMSWAGDKTSTSDLDFLSRVRENHKQKQDPREDGEVEDTPHQNTAQVEELVMVYHPNTALDTDQMRDEFVSTILRAKTKAQRDAMISSALLPFTIGIDIFSFLVGVPTAGALSHIDGLWAKNTVQGARTAGSVVKRLSPSGSEEGRLLTYFVVSQSVEVMGAYLLAKCQREDSKLFPGYYERAPTEEDVLRATAWRPSERAINWVDEQCEVTDAKLDLKNVMKKGAKEWVSCCAYFQRDPVKAAKY